MENSTHKEPTPGKLSGVNLYILGFALFATLIAGVAIGLLINRPVTIQDTPVVISVTSNPNNETVAQATSQSAASASTQTGNENSLPTPTIMDFVLSDARHFRGSPNAPITLIEFSDFK